MNSDILKQAWDHAVATSPAEVDIERLARDARQQVQRYDRAALGRTILGSIAFILALAMLAVVAMVPGLWWGMKVAIVLWSASLLVCLFGLWRLQWRTRRRHDDETLAVHIQACLQRVQAEITYQRSLRWRFWLPFGLGLLAVLGGRSPQGAGGWLIVAIGACAWLWGAVHGPRHWPERLQPDADRLQRTLQSLQTDSAAGPDDTAA